jgi:hypothetical protein
MKLKISWNKPIKMRKATGEGLIYSVDLDEIPDAAGIYVFARAYGTKYKALYVGKANNLKGRIKHQFNNLKLMKYLETAKKGKRVVIAGNAMLQPGQKLDKVLKTLERAFIRHFLAEGHDLVNRQGIRIRRHEILSDGHIKKSFLPSSIYLEKRKGE